MERIVNSTIDTDLYKLTMGQAVFHNFDEIGADFKFINRGKTQFPEGFAQKLEAQIKMMQELSLKPEERRFLEEKCPYLTKDYLDWFADFRFNPEEVSIQQTGGDLQIDINGPWKRTIYWEVPLMATISELYFAETEQVPEFGWEEKCACKAKTLLEAGARYAEFGTRRRFSHEVQDIAIKTLKNNGGASMLGTSNCELAMKHNLTPIGTYAHEWVMGMAGIYGVEEANKKAMEIWAKEFNGKLSTPLTDTYTTEVFLRSYTREMAAIFKTLRQDSGSPERWTDKILTHLNNLGLDPKNFTALYSDALDTKRALEILAYSKEKINVLFGIGTNFTNDVGVKPLNMVIKMFNITKPESLDPIPVVKLSDDLGKISGDKSIVREIAERLEIEI